MKDDLLQEAHIALWRAANAFDHERGIPFSTFAYTCVRNAVSRAASVERRRAMSSLSDPDLFAERGEDNTLRTAMTNEQLDAVKGKFATLEPETQRAINDWCAGHTKTDIAAREGVGTSAICKRISKGVEQLQFAVDA